IQTSRGSSAGPPRAWARQLSSFCACAGSAAGSADVSVQAVTASCSAGVRLSGPVGAGSVGSNAGPLGGVLVGALGEPAGLAASDGDGLSVGEGASVGVDEGAASGVGSADGVVGGSG